MSGEVHFLLNRDAVRVATDGERPLLAVLRDHFGLRGTRFGCGTEQCGACVVLIDGEPAFSCTRTVGSVAGRAVESVEGLAHRGMLDVLHEAFVEEQAAQCGYCISGILVSAAALLTRNPAPGRAEVAAALDRHLCRCGAHNRIVRAVQRAGRKLASEHVR